MYDLAGKSYKRKNFYLWIPYLCYGDYKYYIRYISKHFAIDVDKACLTVEKFIQYKESIKNSLTEQDVEEIDHNDEYDIDNMVIE
jgi:hypothetical protein